MFLPPKIATGRLGRCCRSACGAAAIGAVLAVFSPPVFAEGTATTTALLVPASVPPGEAAPAASAPVPESEIKTRLDNPAALVIAGEKLHASLLRQFYAAHNYEPVWTSRQGQAGALLNLVMRAGEHGIDPELFHARLLRDPGSLPAMDRELLLSDAFLAYADGLANGAVPLEKRMDDEDLTPEPVDVAAVLDRAINSANPAAEIEALAPNTPAYHALRRALRAYDAPEATRPGVTARPGLAAPVNEGHRRQIAVALERLRWLPRHLPADRVWVNTANAQLVLYRDNRPVFTTRVVVGEIDKQTPELQTTIASLLFNPPWNVPPSIAKQEILPKLARDPSYLSRHHMRVRGNGAIQQEAGPHSALGQLKFEMQNRFDVYLHDTPMKALFSRDSRHQSHGCVRVQNPRELAAMLLQQPVEVINKGIALGTTNRKMLPTAVPVFLVYQTAFVEADGRIEFRPDVYERDEEIWQHLHRAQQAPIAQHEAVGQRRS